jgi:hypothetical protein
MGRIRFGRGLLSKMIEWYSGWLNGRFKIIQSIKFCMASTEILLLDSLLPFLIVFLQSIQTSIVIQHMIKPSPRQRIRQRSSKPHKSRSSPFPQPQFRMRSQSIIHHSLRKLSRLLPVLLQLLAIHDNLDFILNRRIQQVARQRRLLIKKILE